MIKKPTQALVGKRVRLVRSNIPDFTLPPGSCGSVAGVDDIGAISVNWENGLTLPLNWEAGDRWIIVGNR
jgi:hypothetical protein